MRSPGIDTYTPRYTIRTSGASRNLVPPAGAPVIWTTWGILLDCVPHPIFQLGEIDKNLCIPLLIEEVVRRIIPTSQERVRILRCFSTDTLS